MKKNLLSIQNKFYESLKQKELMYKEMLEKANKEEENDNIEFNYPFYIFQEIKKKEKEKERKNEREIKEADNLSKQKEEEEEESEAEYNCRTNNDKYYKNASKQLIKTNENYNIIYEY